jgi:hypothetical protein
MRECFLVGQKFSSKKNNQKTLTSTTSFDPTASRRHSILLEREASKDRQTEDGQKKALTNTVSFRAELVQSMPTLLIRLDSEEVFDNANPARQTLHSSNETTD